MAKIKIDRSKLNKAVARSFDRTVEKLSDAFDEAFNDELYDWTGQTKRRNGEIAGSPRNIVDTGELRDSKIVTRSSSSNAVEFEWDSPYAAAVHFGATLRSGTEIPSRPWTEVGLEICDPKVTFEQELKRNL